MFLKLKLEVFPYLEVTPSGIKVTLVMDDNTEVNGVVDFDDLYENTIFGDMSDEQMTDTANALEALAKDIREHILKR